MGFITIIFMQRLQYYVSLRARIYGSLTACLVTFTVPMALALRPLATIDNNSQTRARATALLGLVSPEPAESE